MGKYLKRRPANHRKFHQFDDFLKEEEQPEYRTYQPAILSGRTPGQRQYLQALDNYEITVCHGLAGTGKTWLAVGHAINLLRKREVKKIVVCRPAVEAGEHLGFLPGTATDKVQPFVRPVFDALKDFASTHELESWQRRKSIEIIPLAHMRGLTFHNAYMIGDEFQNATIPQAQLFCTRVGDNSRIVICGSTTQTDIPGGNGLEFCIQRLKLHNWASVIELTEADIVRSKMARKLTVALS